MRKNTRKKQKPFRRTKLVQRGGEKKYYLKVTLKGKGSSNNSNSNSNSNSSNSNSSNSNSNNSNSLYDVEIVTEGTCDSTYKNINNGKTAFAQFFDDYDDERMTSLTSTSLTTQVQEDKILLLPINVTIDEIKSIDDIVWDGQCV